MSTPIAPDSDSHSHVAATGQPATAHEPAAVSSPDPITGEPGAHPVGVGVGALSAGAAGAAIGSIGGPIGVLIGAAIGAVAGGLAGKEVAASSETPTIATESALAHVAADEPTQVLPADVPTPVTMGAIPGEGFRAVAGSGFADDLSLDTTGTSILPEPRHADLEDDAVPMTSGLAAGAAETATGLQTPAVLEDEPLTGTLLPTNSEENVRVAAYYHYLDRTRSGQGGDAVSDWLEAEHETMRS